MKRLVALKVHGKWQPLSRYVSIAFRLLKRLVVLEQAVLAVEHEVAVSIAFRLLKRLVVTNGGRLYAIGAVDVSIAFRLLKRLVVIDVVTTTVERLRRSQLPFGC